MSEMRDYWEKILQRDMLLKKHRPPEFKMYISPALRDAFAKDPEGFKKAWRELIKRFCEDQGLV